MRRTLMMRVWVWLCLAGGLLLAMPVWATRWQMQQDQVFFHLASEQGLPHDVVSALIEDGDGFLWAGTQAGLARWDGYRFKVYNPRAGDPHALPDSWVQALHIDARGRMWVGTAGGGLARYERARDDFTVFAAGPAGVSHVAVNAIVDDGQGGVWVATEGGLDHLDAQDRASHFVHQDQDANSLPANNVGSLMASKDGQLWIGTAKGLVRRALNPAVRARFETIGLADYGTDGVFSLLQASDGRIWIGTRNHGALVLERGQQIAHRTYQGRSDQLNEWIYAMTEVHPGEIWLGSYGQGIRVVDAIHGQQRIIKHDAMLSASLSDDTIWSFYQGRGGLLWIGTGQGINRIDTGQDAILTLYGSKERSDGIPDRNIMSVAEMPDGRVWFGLSNNGIAVFDPERGKVAALSPDNAHPETALQNDSVFAMVPDAQGLVWLGTNRGLYRAQQSGRNIMRQTLPGRNVLESVRVLMQQERLWWVGGDVDGLWQIRSDNGALSRAAQGAAKLPASPGGNWPGLSDLRISALESAAGGMWIGTWHGLNWYDRQSGKITAYLPDQNDPAALFSGAISSMLTDQQGRLWVGTLGGGLHLLQGRRTDGTPRFRRLMLADGLPNVNVNKILQDASGLIWVSTDDGLARIDPATWQVRALRRADGVMFTGYWTNSGTRTTHGELLFGGTGGVTIVRPDRVRDWDYQGPVVASEIRVGGKMVSAHRFNTSVPLPASRHAQPESAWLEMTPDANSLAVEFAALDFSAPQQNRYQYRLEGYDANWIDTDASRRLAAYTNLPPGDYHLRIRGSNRNGIWNPRELVIPLRVHPAWFQSPWWNGFQAVLVLMVLWALVQLRTRWLRQRQRVLAQQVAERTDALHQANGHLQQANRELEEAADILRDLGQVGREITANLDQAAIFTSLSRHVGSLLDVAALTIYRVDADGQQLCLAWGMALYGMQYVALESDSPLAIAAREQQELEHYADSHPDNELALTLSLPLLVDQRLLGVMSIGTDQRLGERERMIFRTLCAYGAIALANVEALQALHQAQARLMQQEKLAALGGLVAGVAHEINTPLGVVLSAMSGVGGVWQQLSAMLESGRVSRSELMLATRDGWELTQLALHNGARAAELIASFKLIAARFDSDQVEYLDVGEYLHEVVELVRNDLELAGHLIRIEAEPGLKVHLVPAALTEAMSRILVNVVDHAFAPGQRGHLQLLAHSAGEQQIRISIVDDGVGIAASDLPHVFDPFFTTRSGQGGHVGLGLTVAFNHVSQRLRGKIRIESTPGQGTRVVLDLPRHETLQAV